MKLKMFVLAMVTALSVGAQDSAVVFVEAGRSIAEAATPARMYRFSRFSPGKILFKDGTTAAGIFNYNFFNEEIEFLTPQGDTLAIARQQMLNIDHVEVGKQVFYFNNHLKNGYLEEVFHTKQGKLLKRSRYDLVKREKIGGYNQPSSTSAIESYSSFTNNYGVMEPKLLVKENLTFKRKAEFFFGDKYNNFFPANKKSLYRLFSKRKKEVDNYLKNSEPDFNQEEELKRLLQELSPDA